MSSVKSGLLSAPIGLQNYLAYIDTLMLKQVLAQPDWGRESSRPEIWDRVNQYGRFELDMNTSSR